MISQSADHPFAGPSFWAVPAYDHRPPGIQVVQGHFANLPSAEKAKALQGLLKLDAQEVLTWGPIPPEEKLKKVHGPRILPVATHEFFPGDQQVAAAALRPVSFGAGTPPLPPRREPAAAFGARPAALWRERRWHSHRGRSRAA